MNLNDCEQNCHRNVTFVIDNNKEGPGLPAANAFCDRAFEMVIASSGLAGKPLGPVNLSILDVATASNRYKEM